MAIVLMYRVGIHMARGQLIEGIADADAALQAAPEDFTYRNLIIDCRDLAMFFLGEDTSSRERRSRRSPAGGAARRLAYITEIVDALASARTTGPEEAAARLAARAPESVARQPQTRGDWLNAFACIAALLGDAARARHIVNTAIPLNGPGYRMGVELLVGSSSGTGTSMWAARNRWDGGLASMAASQTALFIEELDRWS